MKFNTRLFLVIIAGMLAIVIGWVYQDQIKQQDEASVDLEIPDNIDYYFTGMTYRVMRETGDIDYIFKSPRLEHRVRGDTSHIEQPAVTIFRGKDTWLVSANSGQLLHETDVLKLERQVTMQKQGDATLRLESETAIFASEEETVTFPESVLVTSDDAQISAASAIMDMKNNVYRFKQTRTVYQDETT